MSGFGLLNEPFYAQNVLRLVFPYLKKRDKLKCARVCRLWHMIAIHNGLYASMSFCNRNMKYEYLIQRLEYYGTEHLTLKQCYFVVKGKAPNCSISLPRLKTLHIEKCCGFIIHFLISISPNLEELKTLPFNSSVSLRNAANMNYSCLRKASSQVPYTFESIESFSIKFCILTKQYTQLMESCVNLSKLDLVCCLKWNPIKLSNLNRLVTLNLIHCDIHENLEQALSQCSNLKYLTIAPHGKFDVFAELRSNSIILKCAHRLGHRLKKFTWGFTAEYRERICRLYATILRRRIPKKWIRNIRGIPIVLSEFQPGFFIKIELLEKYLKQQNWSASVKICKQFKIEK
ncbi:hypothetical protein ABEB36_003492 [Hypothenemus hampei]|uniref:F-box domain-containing protein n=1 Tax=Hypothenemus hampei TaxID=57062 RepID=A0ABD1F9T3_HYPHA